jgi:hydrogenase maturation protease
VTARDDEATDGAGDDGTVRAGSDADSVAGEYSERRNSVQASASTSDGRILVACMGNILRGDDGFGVAVAEALEDRGVPDFVDITEVGISGVSMAQDLMDGYEAMVLVDAMERDEEPGTLFVERAEVPDLDQYGKREIGSFAADMHQTDPTKVLVLGEALGVLPEPTILVGCAPHDTDGLEDSLSEPVRKAVPRAVDHIEVIIEELEALDE